MGGGWDGSRNFGPITSCVLSESVNNICLEVCISHPMDVSSQDQELPLIHNQQPTTDCNFISSHGTPRRSHPQCQHTSAINSPDVPSTAYPNLPYVLLSRRTRIQKLTGNGQISNNFESDFLQQHWTARGVNGNASSACPLPSHQFASKAVYAGINTTSCQAERNLSLQPKQSVTSCT